METYLSAILCKSAGPGTIVFPPDITDIYNFAPVPVYKKFEGWVDTESPFDDIIPKGTQWIYSVHPVVATGEPEYPLQAGELIAGPYIDVKLAEDAVRQGESKGCFVCIYAALIHADNSKLN